jgi:hypothetical protein
MHRIFAVVFFCLILCVSALPQDRGTIQCEPGSTANVPAWVSPGGANVIEQLECGQMVSIVGLERGFWKIQIGERIGYVDAKYVRLPEGQEQPKELQQPVPLEATGEDATQPYGGDRGKPRRHEGGLNFEVSHIYYGEPDFMRNKGYMWGVSGDYTYRPDKFMLKVDGRFSLGNVDYWSSGSGTDEGLRDYNIETRFSFGYDLGTSDKASFVPFLGLGYRYLFDGESGAQSTSGAYDYDRKSNYLYSPMGMETMFSLGGGWSVGVAGEYDLLWHGWQYSQFDELDPNYFTAKNDQMNGWGARGSVAIIKNFGKIDFAIEPYFRYWDIDQSDITPLVGCTEGQGCYIDFGAEPKNSTMEWGAKVGIRF